MIPDLKEAILKGVKEAGLHGLANAVKEAFEEIAATNPNLPASWQIDTFIGQLNKTAAVN